MRAKLPDESGFIDRDGVRIYYEIYGTGPETMLFVPPWCIVHSRIYKAQLPYFSERFRCITYDGRGNGKSDRPEDVAAYSRDNYVADLLAVMDATDAGKAILVGLSFGGMLASVLAAHHPDRVKAAILVGTVSSIGPDNYAYLANQHFDTKQERFDGWNKYNREHWLADYPDFADHFIRNIHTEPHSTKQIEDGIGWASDTTGPVLVNTVDARLIPPRFDVSEAMYRKICCPVLLIHGDNDQIQRHARAKSLAEVMNAELVTIPDGGHNPLGRIPAKTNTLIVDFLARRLAIASPASRSNRTTRKAKRALYLSSPIGLGHGRRDIAIARELRKLHPDMEVDWLAQDPVTRLLEANGERVHPLSARLASESRHIEMESGEHDLHCFQALRHMDEVLIANFMTFQDAVDEGNYDLVIADEAWDIDHYWHEHPELKKAALAWFTDFVGYVPMPSGGEHEAFLTTDYNAEMIEHIERHPGVRDRAIFVGSLEDIIPLSFGKDLPAMRDWVPRHFDFAGYIIGEHPHIFGSRAELRERLGYRPDERVCIVTVGGSAVGTHLIKRILQSYPMARARLPELRMIVVAGPRIDPASLGAPDGVEMRAFVPDLDRHLAACDLALVQGGLTTCMELTAAGTPFLYFPLQNHFEQNFHVAHRLDRYGAGTRMAFATSTPDMIAEAMVGALRAPAKFKSVEVDGAVRAARMLADLV
ncbi:alpha/beta fold hydrolase [Bradyrhizobium sp. AUGA SZCCT0240]|uniref:alpha/beta hydrolase n=1 Tax=unclassified Bradyrhizobium TaxID=2631580 RepID=UPI001BA9B5D1|nr:MULTISPECIES: alpha/beta hydrolase [unclassified Bradyrhizobium]MBR1199833.1 alpha/beta fold hydrolase [Bradyrhizobium sp. AUGA SZCCT0158]MBR1239130.1 alpha/beta fold hydrolase [Bradyrhizobium sp. AUGA SZCCT0274]MBR1255419.1 alpha/beta fold hydrolase [Bradyrhizobium sp. AUGA SZCCT0240]